MHLRQRIIGVAGAATILLIMSTTGSAMPGRAASGTGARTLAKARLTDSVSRTFANASRAGPAMSASGIDDPVGITAADGALWFTNFHNNSIGQITTTGTVTIYTDPEIDEPLGITSGPDGALWFANYGGNGSIGRITTTGTVTTYTSPGISNPREITVGPDGALWFTNVSDRLTGLHRADHHHRDSHQLHRSQHQLPTGDHVRPGRRAVVHQPNRQHDRADHHERDSHRLHQPQHRRT